MIMLKLKNAPQQEMLQGGMYNKLVFNHCGFFSSHI